MKSLLLFKTTSIIKDKLEAKNGKHQLNEELARWIEMLPLLPILHYPDVSKAIGVMRPGSRGGHFYYDEKGNIRYGQKPIPHLHLVKPGEEPKQEPTKHWTENIAYDPLRVYFKNKLSPESQRAARADLEDFFGKKVHHLTQGDFAGISLEQLVDFRDQALASGSTPATVSRKLSTLRTVADHLLRAKEIEVNPAKLVVGPRLSEISNTQGLTQQEAKALLSQPDRDTTIGSRDYALLYLDLTTGLRRSELADVEVKDIRAEGDKYYLRVRGKGGKDREFELKAEVVSAIADYLQSARHSEGRVFRSHTKEGAGGGLSDYTVDKIVKRYAKLAGITKNISPHSLRHTAITLALDGGATPMQVQKLAGHAHLRTTERYYRTERSSATHFIDL